MYVAPTPFALTLGTTGARTLILPDDFPPDDRFEEVGRLSSRSALNSWWATRSIWLRIL